MCNHLVLPLSELFVSFERAEYPVLENNETVTVCLVTNVGISEDIEVQVIASQLLEGNFARSKISN